MSSKLGRFLLNMGAKLSPEYRVVRVPGGAASPFFSGTMGGGGYLNASSDRLLDAAKNWSGICVDIISDAVASVAVELYTTRGEDWDSVPNDPSLDLLQKPNPAMDGFKLMKLTEASRDVFGNALWYLVSPARGYEPQEIHLIPWPWVRVKRDAKAGIVAYEVQPPGGARFFLSADDCIHFDHPNLWDYQIGRSTLMRAKDAIDLGHFAISANNAFFENGAFIGWVIKTADDWSDEKKTAFYRSFQENHAGFHRAHLPLIIEGQEISVEQTKSGGADIDYTQGLTISRELQLANFRVPPAVLGQTTDFNRANLDGAQYGFQKFAVLPRVQYYYGTGGDHHRAGKLENEYFPRWDPGGNREWRVTYAQFIARDRDQDRADLRTMLGEGSGIPQATINEVRDRFWGMDPRDEENGDEVLLQAGKVRLSDDDLSAFAPVAFAAGEAEHKATGDADYITWKRFVREHARFERELFGILKREFARQKVEIIKRARRLIPKAIGYVNGWSAGKAKAFLVERKDLIDDLMPAGEAEKFAEAMIPLGIEAVIESARRAYAAVGIRVPRKSLETRDLFPELPAVDNPILEAAIEAWVRDAFLFAATELTGTTIKRLRNNIVDIIASGGRLEDVVSAIDDVYGDLTRSRAFTIARTEMTGAWNHGILEVGASVDFDVRKRWVPARDERTRKTHLDAGMRYGQGRGIALDETFEVGGESLSSPGDPAASPGNRVNCRCTLVIEPSEG